MSNVRWVTGVVGLVTAALSAIGCVAPIGAAEETAETSQAIRDGSVATPFYWSRSALFDNCTGTAIAPRFVLTAAHCREQVGDTFRYYTTGPTPSGVSTRAIVDVSIKSGVHPGSDDYSDSNGKFADIAVIKNAFDAPPEVNYAVMAWHYPSGGNEWGTKVGAAEATSITNFPWPIEETEAPFKLRTKTDQVYSDNDNDGHFLTENEDTSGGDSGGGFFDNLRLLGVLYGDEFEWERRNKYTSVPFHLGWILGKIEYQWPGNTPNVGRCRSGPSVDLIMNHSEKVCQYACEHTSGCVAYNYMDIGQTLCSLLSSVDDGYDNPLCSSARR